MTHIFYPYVGYANFYDAHKLVTSNKRRRTYVKQTMQAIRHKNNIDGWLHIIIIIIISVSGYLLVTIYDKPVLFACACLGLLLLLLFLQFRRLKISVDKNTITIDFLFLSIPYRRIKKYFDFAKVTTHDTGSIFFVKDNREILEFDYDDDPAEPTVEIGVLKIIHRNKEILFGNTKTSYKLFNEIRTVLSQSVLADT